jgi:TPR repeat protein
VGSRKFKVSCRKPRNGAKKSLNEKTSARQLFAEGRRLVTFPANEGDLKVGFAFIQRASIMGEALAHEWLGAMYDYGLGVRKNGRLAFKHYRIAAEGRQPNSEYHLGIFYKEGVGVNPNQRLAAFWLERAARHGDAVALHTLGKCYRSGEGVLRNAARGFHYHLRAASRGVMEAQFSVGVCLSRGDGVTADLRKAFKWYLAAARRGHPDAAYNLGLFYQTGRGVRMSKSRSEFWYKRAKVLEQSERGARQPSVGRRGGISGEETSRTAGRKIAQ